VHAEGDRHGGGIDLGRGEEVPLVHARKAGAGDRHAGEDLAAAVIDHENHEGGGCFARGNQAAEVVHEADIAEHEEHGCASAGRSRRRRDEAVDPGCPALGDHRSDT